MNYGYNGQSDGKLIHCFEIIDDKILITFLDDNIVEMPFTEDNKNVLLNMMIEQAEERNKSMASYYASEDKAKNKRLIVLDTICAFGNLFSLFSLLQVLFELLMHFYVAILAKN